MDVGAHVLIVDDDERIRGLLQKFLMRNGFMASIAHDAAHARRLLQGLVFDLIILDVMMPGEDGISLCNDIRQSHDTPILLLTARGDAPDRITGLEAGADDYLPKPFEPKELLLRLNAILRRTPQPAQDLSVPQILYLGPVRYDLERGEMWHDTNPVRLTTTEAVLMHVFSTRVNETLSRADLVEILNRGKNFPTEHIQERAVDVQITRLRRKIEVNPKQPRYLQTVRGVGYTLVPD